MGVLAEFLEKKSGYCVHFSAAMAVMAREVGIPSRIAVGYTSGTRATSLDEPVQEDGSQMRGFEVTGRDAHAWPELYFEGLGWVPFEPTPSRGYVPAYAQEEFTPETTTEDNPSAAAQPSATAETTAATATTVAAVGAEAASIDVGRWLAGAGWVLLVLVLLTIPAVFRHLVRRRRLALVRAGTSGSPELLAWREVLATTVDHGCPVDPALTPAMQAATIATFLGRTSPPGLELLLHAYEQAAYGSAPANAEPVGRDDLADAAETLVARFQSSVAPARRLRAIWLPASLIRRPS